jgi:broad specificity phosphatase PhoE
LRRCRETAEVIFKDLEIVKDDRLLEYNYGEAEGLSYEQLVSQYPEIFTSWQNDEDPRFPDGENTKDVYGRLKSFLDNLAQSIENNQSGPICIVTHNGVLRCLLGEAFGLNLNEWYKLLIPHGVPLEFLYWRNRFYPNISRTLWFEIFHNIGCAVS